WAFATSGQTSLLELRNELGRSAAIYMGCAGTLGRWDTNNINSTNVPTILKTGVGTTGVMGGVSGTVANAVAKSTVLDVRLLGGLILADAVYGVARSSYDTATHQPATSFTGSHFVNLHVAGTAVADDVAPNTQISM